MYRKVEFFFLVLYFFISVVYILCTPVLSVGRIFKNGGGGGLTGPYLLEGGCWERGGDFFQGE